MPKFSWLALLLLLPVGAIAPERAGATPAAPFAVDRRTAVAYTLAHNPTVQAAAAQLEAARSHVKQARALPNPQLGFSFSGVNPQNQAGQSVLLQFTQTLQLTDTRRLKTEMAGEDILVAEWALALTRQQAALATKKAYNQVLAMRFALEVARSNLTWNRRLARAAAEKLRLGEIAAVDSFRAKVALAQAEQDFMSARNDRYQALESLKLAMGHIAPVALAGNVPYEIPLLPLPQLATLVARGLQHRPEIAQGQAGIRHEVLNQQLLEASVMPGFDVITGIGPVAGVPGVSGGVNLPLPLWYRQQGELAQSQATQAGLKAQQQATENGIVIQVEQTAGQLKLNEGQIRLYQRNLLPNARSLLAQARQRFLYGDASGYELQDAQRSYRQAMAAYGQAYLAYRNSLADLEISLGTDLPQPKE